MPEPDPAHSPIPSDWSVSAGRDAYLAENGFTTEAYDADWTDASVLGIRFRVPNTARHRWAIRLHDLHHVVTGFGTDFVGEAEVSAWECGGGLRGLGLYTGAIVAGLALGGLVVAPRRTWRAFRASGSTNLFGGHRPESEESDYDALLSLSVGALRHRLGVPRDGLAREPRALHAYAPPHATLEDS